MKNIKNENSVSAIILVGVSRNKKLYEKCIKSLSWCDEIVKVETDKLKGSFSDWRNLGAKKAKSDWVLYVDTDEEVTPKLASAINKAIKSDKFNAYAIPRRNFIFGKEFKHGGQWPDYVLRLIRKKDLKRWEGKLHEQPKVKGEIGYIDEPFIHRKHKDISEMIKKTNEWSEIEADLMLTSGHPPMNALRFFSAGLREFFLRMIKQLAFLDGVEGIIYAMYQVYSRLISYTKLWERQISTQ